MRRRNKPCEGDGEDGTGCGAKPAAYRILADAFMCERCWRLYQADTVMERMAMNAPNGSGEEW